MISKTTQSEQTGPSLTDMSNQDIADMMFQTEKGLVILKAELMRRLIEATKKEPIKKLLIGAGY